jgi:hypothetical protein
VALLALDRAWDRIRQRIFGLTQAEYVWEPVVGMWSVRLGADGVWRVQRVARDAPDPVPAPVTTVAWRLWHIGSECLAEYTANGLGAWPLPGLEVNGSDWFEHVGDALDAVDTSWNAFRGGLGGLGEDGLWRPLGPGWGSYGSAPWVSLALHALDELSHHGAEIALLRDLHARAGLPR